ncbi:ABC transporter permease [Bradyrhizobium sp. LHD-71]|uniref:ABC transporter permease n=1 Tax=Bradyrhizobium sp. LHD-71 TaxID=3072141 RepID=UPI00280C8A3E|nr:ABC transporter permease [Bradyrhizobium sp. LHD-71]MDQ8728100.1 ABC transporter permease [Bradyrhizobium sp. LHD-71]
MTVVVQAHDILRLAVSGLRRNAFRSMLAALGIAIGVGAMVAVVTIGRGSSAKVGEQLDQLGAQLLALRVGQDARGGQGAQIEAKPLTYADVEAVRQFRSELQAIAPVASQSVRVASRQANWVAAVTGADNDFLVAKKWRLVKGRAFSDREMRSGSNVCIIGATVHERLFGGDVAVGETIRVKTVSCEVIGVLGRRGQSGLSQDDDNTVIMPLANYQRRVLGSRDIQSIVVLVRQGIDTSLMKNRLEELMRERRRIDEGQEDNFHVLEMRQVADAMAETSRTLTALLTAVAAISVLVGGIGIMNIMLASVADRTSEIGVRLAIGALPRQILAQVLAEAVFLAAAGGLAGIVVGLGLAAVARLWLQIPLVVDPAVVLLSLAASAGIGMLFGYLPAARAAQLDPAEAIRRE